MNDLLERLRARADNAYCDYIGQLRRDECLGWEIKVERGKFGEAEMKAHCAAAEKLGRHRALHEAANLLEEALRSNNTSLLRRHAIRLWHGNRAYARKWLASVDFLRTRGGGWVLDGAPGWRHRGRI